MIGIDIGSRFIKLVALGRCRRCWQVKACLTGKSGGNPEADLQAVLQRLPSPLRRKLPDVSVALPTSELLIKTVQLPCGLAHEQIDLALRMEFGQAPENEKIYLDYRRIQKPEQDAAAEQLLAVACRQSLMDSSLAALHSLGIHPAVVAADVLLIADSVYIRPDNPELVLFIDAGATGVRLYSMRSGVPGYSRNHKMPDNSCVFTDPGAYLLLLRRAVQQFRMFDMLSRPAKLFLYGGAAALPGVSSFLQQVFELPVKCIEPFSDGNHAGSEQFTPSAELHQSAFTLAYMLARKDALCV